MILLGSLAFRLHVANECSLWLDEVSTWSYVQEPWAKVVQGPNIGHLPLMYVLVKAATTLLGDGDVAVRSVSLLFGCFLLIALQELCLELRLSVPKALVVVATFALTSFFIRQATEARHYALLMAFSTFAVTRALRLLRGSERWSDWLLFAAAESGAAATHYLGLAYAAVLLGVVGLGAPWSQKRPSLIGRLGVLLGCLTVLARVGWGARQASAEFGVGQVGAEAAVGFNMGLLREVLGEFSFLAGPGWSVAVQPVLSLLGLALLTRRLSGVARLLPFGLGLAPWLAGAAVPAAHFWAARYFAPSAVFWHLGACVSLFAIAERLRTGFDRRLHVTWVPATLYVVAFSGLLASRLSEYPSGFGAGSDDYRAFQQYFATHLAFRTRVVTYPGPFGIHLLGWRYPVVGWPIALEAFEPRRRARRYVIVEIHTDGAERQKELESLVARKFGMSPEAWRATPLIRVPHSMYQTAVRARLVTLPRETRNQRHEEHHQRH